MKKLKPFVTIKKYYSDKIVKQLNLKNDCFIKGTKIYILNDFIYSEKALKMIDNPEKRFDLGNRSQGKIDYLTKVHNFHLQYINTFKNLKR